MKRKPTGKSAEQVLKESSERMRNNNPMRRPDVAARVGAALKQRIACDPTMRSVVEQNLAKGRVWTDARKAAAAQRAAKIWTEEMRQAARKRSVDYQNRVRAALAASPVKV